MFVLPVIVYFLFLAVYFNRKKNIVESVVVSWLFVTLYTWLVVELSSLFGALSTVTVFFSWGAACAVFGVYALRNHVLRKTLTYFRTDYQISCILTEHKANLVCLLVFCSLIFLLSALRSQNLIDNLYHRLTKILHWIQNGNVGYFATAVPGEIQYSKLVEYMNAQIYLLKGPDRLINIVQAGAYVCSGCCVYGIGRKIGASRRFAFLSAWIFLLTPMVIVETLTTQTDVAAGFYLLSFVYFLLDYIHVDKLHMDRRWAFLAVCLSTSVMFGYLTKPTVCFAMVFFFLWMCIVRIVKRDKVTVLLQHVLIGAVVAIVLFVPETARYYQYRQIPNAVYDVPAVNEDAGQETEEEAGDGSVGQSGGQQANTVQPNESIDAVSEADVQEETPEDKRVDNNTVADKVVSNLFNPKEVVVVAVRNLAATATSRCFPKINNMLTRFVEKCESVLNYSGGYRYFRVLAEEGFGETSEPSPAIMLFFALSWLCVVFRISKIKTEQLLYLLLGSVSMVVQAGLMSYTWYNQRYLLGVLALMCPVFGVILENIPAGIKMRSNLAVAMVTVCCFGVVNALSYEIPYVVFGFQGQKIHQYLFHDSDAEAYYESMLDFINENGYETVGMYGYVSYEYVLWQGIEDLERMEHVNMEPVHFESAKLSDTTFVPQCIVEEMPEVFGMDETLYCNGQTYVCGWSAVGENGRNYVVLVADGQ